MKSAIAAASFAAMAAALPAPQTSSASTSTRFEGMSLRSASPIHFGRIAANGLSFWIGKETATYCPDESVPEACESANANDTIFSYTNGYSTLGLVTEVPGGQQIYIAEGDESIGQKAGELKFTQAHSVSTSGPALYEGFEVVYDSQLQFEGDDWIACEEDGAYKIYAASRIQVYNDGCLGFTWKDIQVEDSTPAAWQYTK